MNQRKWINQKKKLILIFLPALLYGSESWVARVKNISRITVVEMKYLRRVAVKRTMTRRDCARNKIIREQLEIPTLMDTSDN